MNAPGSLNPSPLHPGILKVFWPAIMGWGGFGALFTMISRPIWFLWIISEPVSNSVFYTAAGVVMLAPICALVVAVRTPAPRPILSTVFNLSTLLPALYAALMVLLAQVHLRFG